MIRNRTIRIEDIRGKNPCYDPSRYLPEGWSGQLTDILLNSDVPAKDRVWVVSRFADDKSNRLFAVYCGRYALSLVKFPDPRSLTACDVAEQYALGNATAEQLIGARHAAYDAADDAVDDAVAYATYDAAHVTYADAYDASGAASAQAYAYAVAADAATASAHAATHARAYAYVAYAYVADAASATSLFINEYVRLLSTEEGVGNG